MKNFKKQIADRLRARRREIGFKTQEDLAAVIGVDRSRVSKWESGAAYPDPEFRQALTDALKLSKDFFDASESDRSVSNIKAELLAEVVRMDDKSALKWLKRIRAGSEDIDGRNEDKRGSFG